MREIISGKPFEKELKKFLKKNPHLIDNFEDVYFRLSKDVFDPKLKTHKLNGDLKDSYACSINYSVRLIFNFDDKNVYLEMIGTHDEVY